MSDRTPPPTKEKPVQTSPRKTLLESLDNSIEKSEFPKIFPRKKSEK